MARLHTSNRRRARRFGPHSDVERRMASCHDGAAVIARARARGLRSGWCVGLANLQRGYQQEGRLQAIYKLPDGRHAFVMDDGVTYSRPKRGKGE